MAKFSLPAAFTLEVAQDYVEYRLDRDSLDPNWRGTCTNGHRVTLRTTNLVVDESHWCDGTEGWARHDPHEHVDRSHYECRKCGVTVEVGIVPAGFPVGVPGLKHTTLVGQRSDGTEISAWLDGEMTSRAFALMDEGTYAEQVAFLDDLPMSFISSVRYVSR
jgi:hypothetical protein